MSSSRRKMGVFSSSRLLLRKNSSFMAEACHGNERPVDFSCQRAKTASRRRRFFMTVSAARHVPRYTDVAPPPPPPAGIEVTKDSPDAAALRALAKVHPMRAQLVRRAQ